MRKNNLCPECGSDEEVEVITGGITIKVLRKGEFTIRDEITYEATDEYSKWYCPKCNPEILSKNQPALTSQDLPVRD